MWMELWIRWNVERYIYQVLIFNEGRINGIWKLYSLEMKKIKWHVISDAIKMAAKYMKSNKAAESDVKWQKCSQNCNLVIMKLLHEETKTNTRTNPFNWKSTKVANLKLRKLTNDPSNYRAISKFDSWTLPSTLLKEK